MAAGYARIRVLGRIGETPEVKEVGGKKLCRISLCVNDSENKGEAEWFQAIFWGKLAETVVEFTSKGSEIEVYGYPHLRKWKGQDGSMKSELQIRVSDVYFTNTPRRPKGYDPDEKL